jgi:anti-sigma regulatory factor (Ser/Thr protein kinase)
MSTVALRFSPAAEHVRTARLVTVAVARRAGLAEEQLDAVRLAVGETCARAVRRCGLTGVTRPMLVEVDDGGPRLEIIVTDEAAATDSEDDYLALALVRGLSDGVQLADGPGGQGGRVTMCWDRARPEPAG